VVGRAFVEAWKQASASSKYAKARMNEDNGTARNLASAGLTLAEACKILNVKPPAGGKADLEVVRERFKKLFDANDPKQGGSFYLQSKILRAKDRIEMEVREVRDAEAEEAEIKKGWNPKVYNNK
jgi:mitochondrial import inner membrane translocase subunit TIM16